MGKVVSLRIYVVPYPGQRCLSDTYLLRFYMPAADYLRPTRCNNDLRVDHSSDIRDWWANLPGDRPAAHKEKAVL